MSRIRIIVAIAMLTLSGCVSENSPKSAKPPVVNLDAVLPPQSLLRDDTNAALTHDRGESRLAYVGVWASDGEKCAMMDQTAFQGFAVITPDSIRRSGETCEISQGQPGSAVNRLDATCKARGKKTATRSITLQMLSSRQMRLSTDTDASGTTMVRCRVLPSPDLPR